MMSIRSTLTEDIQSRMEALDSRSGAYPIKGLGADVIERVATPNLLMQLCRVPSLTSVLVALGQTLLKEHGLPRNTLVAAKVGALVIEAYISAKVLKIEMERQKRKTVYILRPGEPKVIKQLIEESGFEGYTAQAPSLTPYDPWVSYFNDDTPLIKGRYKPNGMNPTDQPLIFKALNKAQATGWQINDRVLDVYAALMGNRDLSELDGSWAFTHMEPRQSRTARMGREVLATITLDLAERFRGETFFHMYNLDFRGRMYPCSSTLNEQASDYSKGLLKLAEGAEMGPDGFTWFSINMCNLWGEDKLSLADRFLFTQMHTDEWLEFAKAPLENRGWLHAEKPWSFLAACFELADIVAHGDVETYVSHIPVYIDGTNNGVQHLAAMAGDESIGALVNLVPSTGVGDVYAHIAKAVWASIDSEVTVPMGDLDEDNTPEELEAMAPAFFAGVTDLKIRRKLVKRCVMVLAYGGTRYGFKSIVMEDAKQIGEQFRAMPFCFAAYLGNKLYDICRGTSGDDSALPGPAALLSVFEDAADSFSDRDEHMRWKTPITNMLVEQRYLKSDRQRTEVKILGERYQLTVKVDDSTRLNPPKQRLGAAPNIVHSLDAAHLISVCAHTSYTTPTIHDSFGSLPGHMADLFETCRELFVDLYAMDPLGYLLDQWGETENLKVERGSLNLEAIIESDFAFS